MTTRIMHLDLDAFFVEVCRQHDPALRDEPLLVVGGRRDSRGVVQSASYGAREFGVRSGMPIAEAVRRCPGAVFVQGPFARYREASRQVREVLLGHAPVVAMAGLDEAYLDFSGTDRLWPVSLLPAAERLVQGVRAATGLDCSVGIGPNRMVAKIASAAAKPRGLLEVRPGWEEEFLAGLPLAALPGVGPKTVERWAAAGLRWVHEAQALSLGQLERRVGPAAKWLKLRAHGHGSGPLRPGRAARSMSRETTLRHDLADPAEAARVLDRLAVRVASQLREELLEARTITLKIRWDDFTTRTRGRTLPRSTALDGEIRAAARDLLEPAWRELRRRGRRVRLLGVAATNLVPAEPPDLFEPAARQRARTLSSAVDEVRGRFGFGALTPGSLLPGGREPDRS